MQAYAVDSSDEKYFRNVGASLAIHVLILLFFMVRAIVFPDQERAHMDAIRVDMVALPDKMPVVQPEAPKSVAEVKKALEEKKTKPAEIKKELPKKSEEAINLEASKNKQKAALNKLKEMSAIEKLEQDEQKEKKEKALKKLQQYKGAALSSGSELQGVAKLAHDAYIEKVEKHIRQYWTLPNWLASKNLSAQVQVTFDSNGNVVDKKIVKSSGNKSFDDVVIQTVMSASPVPAPPADFVGILANEGVTIGFPE